MYKRIAQIITFIFLLFWIIACQAITNQSTITPSPVTESGTPRKLTICLGYEPESLYLYNTSSQSAWAIWEAIYDGPIDTLHFSSVSVILEKMPSFADGDAYFQPIEVKAGDEVIDIYGNPVKLVKDVLIYPHGCSSNNCALNWDGESELQMDQLFLSFKLISGIRWSDGQRLTAQDSIYSFQVASDTSTPNDKRTIQQTAKYSATDDRTIVWAGKPGFLTQEFQNYFWLPLPKHIWSKYSPEELLTAQESSKLPMGWGPYVIQEWQVGQFIRLTKNTNYFRAEEGLPKFDELIYRFINVQGDANITAVVKYKCDFVNQTTLMNDQTNMLDYLLNYYRNPQIRVPIGYGPKIEYLIFNTNSSGNQNSTTFRFLKDQSLRKAISSCIDRNEINRIFFDKLTKIPLTYAPPGHPYYTKDLESIEFDPDKSQSQLENLGWKDTDRNPNTPRVSLGVANIPDGTPLKIHYITDKSEFTISIAENISQSLAKCGIMVELTHYAENEYLAPEGPFWQSDFDLAQFAWITGKVPPCFLFSSPSQQLLGDQSFTLSYNVGQYSNPEFDALCKVSLEPLITPENQLILQAKMQEIINRDLPVLPLFTHLQIDVARRDFCPYELDISARSDLWNIESMDHNSDCLPK